MGVPERKWNPFVLLMLVAALGCGGGGGGDDPGHSEPDPDGSPMLACVAPERPPSPFGYRLEPLIEGLELELPTVARPDPTEPGRWWAVEQPGRLVTFTEQDPSLSVLLDVSERIAVHPNFEIGLLGFAFHPRFPEVPWVYLSLTAHPETEGMIATFVLSAFRVDDEAIDLASERVLLRIDLPTEFHHGGTLEFDEAGMLLVSLGDGGVRENGQNPSTLLGSLLRIDVDGAEPYGIPDDNPLLADPGARPETYAYGFRNLWKFTIDRATGRVFGGDVGGGELEEVSAIQAGADHGWPTWEGTLCRIEPCQEAGVQPLAEYSHDEGRAVIGGPVYRGGALSDLTGKLLYGDWLNTKIWAVDPDTADPEPELLLETGETLSSFAEDADGEVYVLVRLGTDNLRRLVPNDREDGVDLPSRLSETGCADLERPTEAAAHLLPYDVNLPLWSDGLEKDRWLSLPTDGKIRVHDDGDWNLPIGTILVKRFRRGDDMLETRLFMRHPDGSWAGYTYAWNEDESEAWLQRGSLRIELGDDEVWTLPTRSECLQCHTEAAGRTLGMETGQLDRLVVDSATGDAVSQIELWKDLGLFEDPNAPGLATGDPYRALNDRSASLETRARDYLHVNCSGCHRPDATGLLHLDFRRQTPFSEMGLCGEEPQVEDDDFGGQLLLEPGNAPQSILMRRLTRRSYRRMPPLGTIVPDLDAIRILRFWIAGLESCPDADGS